LFYALGIISSYEVLRDIISYWIYCIFIVLPFFLITCVPICILFILQKIYIEIYKCCFKPDSINRKCCFTADISSSAFVEDPQRHTKSHCIDNFRLKRKNKLLNISQINKISDVDTENKNLNHQITSIYDKIEQLERHIKNNNKKQN